MPTTVSQRALAALCDEAAPAAPAAVATKRWTPVFIIASPRPLTGKTFLARLVADFLRVDGGDVNVFDLSPEEGSIADLIPDLTSKADIQSTPGQVALFDRLILDDGTAKVVDLPHNVFERFFAVIGEIGFIDEAHRRTIEPVILYPADQHRISVQSYARLQGRFPGMVLVPVFNEGIIKGRKLRDQYPFDRAAAVPLQIPALPPALKAYAERSAHSFAEFYSQLPMSVPLGPAFELRAWTKRAFLEFRELELRLLLEKLRSSLKGET